MDEFDQKPKIFSSGYAAAIHGGEVVSAESPLFCEKETDGTVGSANLYLLAQGKAGSYQPEAAGLFIARKVNYEFFRSFDYINLDKLANAIHIANDEMLEYAAAQGETINGFVIAAAISDGEMVLASIGNNHAYIVRKGTAYQINVDSSEEGEGSSSLDPGAPTPALGVTKDFLVDGYDPTKLRPGDVLILVSHSLDTIVGKKEVAEAAFETTPQGIVEAILDFPAALGREDIAGSAAAVKIYSAEDIANVVRAEGTDPADTDLNSTGKEIRLIRETHKKAEDRKRKRKGINWKIPVIALSGLLTLVAVVLGLTGNLDQILPGSPTRTPTIDVVQVTVNAMRATFESDKIHAVAATISSIPTQTPYPTWTPVYYDMDATLTVIREQERAFAVATAISSNTQPQQPVQPENFAGNTADVLPNEGGVVEIQPADATANEPVTTQVPSVVQDPKQAALLSSLTLPKAIEEDGRDMVLVPAGEFLLGADPAVDPLSNPEEEQPQMTVLLSPFWIDKYEVTNRQYQDCVDAGYCGYNASGLLYNADYYDYPVSYLTKEQAEYYCQWVGGRLPTEFEWEKAARGTDGRLYPWGNDKPSISNELANIPNYYETVGGNEELMPVGTFPKGASPYGVEDMAGNVWEWTSTYFSTTTYQSMGAQAEVDGSVLKDPTGPEYGSMYVIRGGSCASSEVNQYETYLRTTNRGYINAGSSYYVGFRCVIPAESAQPAAEN